MHIVTRRHLQEAIDRYPDAGIEIRAWATIVESVRWHSFMEIRSIFKDADYVNGYVVFNLSKNRYGLITLIHYAKSTIGRRTAEHVYVLSFLMHKEYDNPNNCDKRFGTR